MVEWFDEAITGTVAAMLVAAGIIRLAAPQESPKPIPLRVRARRRIIRR